MKELLLGIGHVAYRLAKRSIKKRKIKNAYIGGKSADTLIKNADKAIAIFLNGGN